MFDNIKAFYNKARNFTYRHFQFFPYPTAIPLFIGMIAILFLTTSLITSPFTLAIMGSAVAILSQLFVRLSTTPPKDRDNVDAKFLNEDKEKKALNEEEEKDSDLPDTLSNDVELSNGSNDISVST